MDRGGLEEQDRFIDTTNKDWWIECQPVSSAGG
jgi:hypothetical protein